MWAFVYFKPKRILHISKTITHFIILPCLSLSAPSFSSLTSETLMAAATSSISTVRPPLTKQISYSSSSLSSLSFRQSIFTKWEILKITHSQSDLGHHELLFEKPLLSKDSSSFPLQNPQKNLWLEHFQRQPPYRQLSPLRQNIYVCFFYSFLFIFIIFSCIIFSFVM